MQQNNRNRSKSNSIEYERWEIRRVEKTIKARIKSFAGKKDISIPEALKRIVLMALGEER